MTVTAATPVKALVQGGAAYCLHSGAIRDQVRAAPLEGFTSAPLVHVRGAILVRTKGEAAEGLVAGNPNQHVYVEDF